MYEGTGTGLLEFLDYVKAKGMLAGSTADAYKSACMRVLGIDENWTSTDVRSLDVELQMGRYIRRRGASAKPASLTTYGQRVRAAIELYRTFLDNPAGFRGSTAKQRSSSSSTRSTGLRSTERTEKLEAKGGSETRDSTRNPPLEFGSSLVTYPFPLRSGAMAYLQLPRHLAGSDVRRLCAFLSSLAIDAADEPSDEDAG